MSSEFPSQRPKHTRKLAAANVAAKLEKPRRMLGLAAGQTPRLLRKAVGSPQFAAAASPPSEHPRRWGHRRYRCDAAAVEISLVGPTSRQRRTGSAGKVRTLVRMPKMSLAPRLARRALPPREASPAT